MKPEIIGRTIGTGLRVAGRIVGQHVAASAQAAATPSTQPPLDISAQSRSAGQVAGQSTRGVARGVGAFLRPFRRIGGILWLEVTGVFFLLPAIVFAPSLWRLRASWLTGPDHKTFVVTAIVVLVFLYLGVTSFWRARRK
ncbi:MAG: hypothetical protein ABR956_01170 [Terracidiphilus sp.]